MLIGAQGMAQQKEVKSETTPFKEYNVQQADDINPFNIFTGWGLLLCAGDKESSHDHRLGRTGNDLGPQQYGDGICGREALYQEVYG